MVVMVVIQEVEEGHLMVVVEKYLMVVVVVDQLMVVELLNRQRLPIRTV